MSSRGQGHDAPHPPGRPWRLRCQRDDYVMHFASEQQARQRARDVEGRTWGMSCTGPHVISCVGEIKPKRSLRHAATVTEPTADIWQVKDTATGVSIYRNGTYLLTGAYAPYIVLADRPRTGWTITTWCESKRNARNAAGAIRACYPKATVAALDIREDMT